MAGVMLNALAPAGPAAPVVPAAPPSLSNPTPPDQREGFRDVYHSVPDGQDSSNEGKPKEKITNTNSARAKETGGGDKDNKPAVLAVPHAPSPALLKAPLAFTLAIFGPAADAQAAGENPDGKEDAEQGAGKSDAMAESPKIALAAVKEGVPIAVNSVARSEPVAFTARLTTVEAQPRPSANLRPPAPVSARYQANNQAQNPVEPRSNAASGNDAYPIDTAAKLSRPQALVAAQDLPVVASVDFRAPAPAQSPETVHPAGSRTIGVQDVQPIVPEVPKPPASSEILLQLAGNDHSTASVRVVDRSGTVNVSVHASDPELRTSLRSNLSDLASQLSSQGFKTEMAKPTVTAANAENQHDSRHNNQDSFRQQQHSPAQDGRPGQRDRRANSEQWLEQLEQETSGNPGIAGGRS